MKRTILSIAMATSLCAASAFAGSQPGPQQSSPTPPGAQSGQTPVTGQTPSSGRVQSDSRRHKHHKKHSDSSTKSHRDNKTQN
jgi:uncharacterized protein YdeI (BOF family)